jgi:uncharacterized protein YceK
MKLRNLLIFSIFISSLCGCATSLATKGRLAGQQDKSTQENNSVRSTPLDLDLSVYPATKLDYLGFLVFCCSDYIDTESKQSLSAHIFTKTVIPLMCIVDLPFSIVSDTLLLPIDIYSMSKKNEPEIEKPNHEIKLDEI